MTARMTPAAAVAVRAAIRLAGGREVCFVCAVDDEGTLTTARVVARGDVRSVLALPGFAQRGEMLLHNHPSGQLEPSGPDLEIAARVHDDGVGFAITDNLASSVYVVVEVPRAREIHRLDLEAIEHDLGGNGPIAACHARYEDRAGQRAYARTVTRLYNGGGIGLLEAGTWRWARGAIRAVRRAVAEDEAECEVLSHQEDVNEPRVDVTLAVSLLKNPGRFDFLVEKATELGVRSIIPMICERTVRHNEHHERLVKIAVSAMKQSGRSFLPEIFFKTPVTTLIMNAEQYDLKLIPHEKTEQSHFIDTVLHHHRDARSILVLIGPEGGFTDTELAEASGRGFVPICLGPRRLRTETAAVSALCHCVGCW